MLKVMKDRLNKLKKHVIIIALIAELNYFKILILLNMKQETPNQHLVGLSFKKQMKNKLLLVDSILLFLRIGSMIVAADRE